MQSKLFTGLNLLFVATSGSDLDDFNGAIEQAKLHGANDIQLYKLYEDPECFSSPTLSAIDTKLWFLERFSRQGRIEPHFIIATNTSFAFYKDIAFDLLIPVVSPMWIHNSVRLQHLAKTFNYSPDPLNAFRNFEFYISRDSFPTPAERLFYKIIIMSLGGACTSTLSRTTDYIVTRNTEDIAIKAVLRFGMDSTVKFVYPTWLIACFKRQKLLDDVPHFVGCNDPGAAVPKELWRDCHSMPFTTPRFGSGVGTFEGRTRERASPRKGIFNGYKFILNDDLGVDDNETLVLRDLIEANGGDVLGAFDGEIERITHRDRKKRCVMVSHYAHRQTLPCAGSAKGSSMEAVKTAAPVISGVVARRKDIPTGNLIWLFYMCKVGRYVNPEEKLIFRPFERLVGNKKPQSDLSLSYSNYFGFQRPYIKLLTKLLGGRATSDFSKENNYLVCRTPCGRKYQVATTIWKDRCTVVTHLWLEDCLRVGRQLYPSGASEYKLIPLKPSLSQMINQKRATSQQTITDSVPEVAPKRLYSKGNLHSLTHQNNLVSGQLDLESVIRPAKDPSTPLPAGTCEKNTDDTTSTSCSSYDTTPSGDAASSASVEMTNTSATTPDDSLCFTAASSPNCTNPASKKLTTVSVLELGSKIKEKSVDKNLCDQGPKSSTGEPHESALKPALVVTKGKQCKKRTSTSQLAEIEQEGLKRAEYLVKRAEPDKTMPEHGMQQTYGSEIITTPVRKTSALTMEGEGSLVNREDQSTPLTSPKRRRTRRCRTAVLETPRSVPTTLFMHSPVTNLDMKRVRHASLSPYAETERRDRAAELDCEAFTVLSNLARRFKRDSLITEIPRIYNINAVVTNCLEDLTDLDLHILTYLGVTIHRDIDTVVESQLNGVIAPKRLRTAKFLRSLGFTPLRYALLPKFILDLLGLIHDPITCSLTEGTTFTDYLALRLEKYRIPEISQSLLDTTELSSKVFERAQIRRVNIVQDITGGTKTITAILKAHGIEEVAVLKGRSKKEDVLRNTNKESPTQVASLSPNGNPGVSHCVVPQDDRRKDQFVQPKFVPEYVIIVRKDLQAKRFFKLLKPVAEPLIVEWDWCVQCIFNLSVDYSDLTHVKSCPGLISHT